MSTHGLDEAILGLIRDRSNRIGVSFEMLMTAHNDQELIIMAEKEYSQQQADDNRTGG